MHCGYECYESYKMYQISCVLAHADLIMCLHANTGAAVYVFCMTDRRCFAPHRPSMRLSISLGNVREMHRDQLSRRTSCGQGKAILALNKHVTRISTRTEDTQVPTSVHSAFKLVPPLAQPAQSGHDKLYLRSWVFQVSMLPGCPLAEY